MIEDVSKTEELKRLVSKWYTIAPVFREKYKGKDPSSYNKKEVNQIIFLKNKIDILEKELKLKPSDKFWMLMELI